jgi:hypothetical protein
MKILFSVPSGFHLRELLLPLKHFLEADNSLEKINVATPAAAFHQKIFPTFGSKFIFTDQPKFTDLNLVITNTTGLDSYDLPLLREAKINKIPTLTFISSWDNIWKIERHIKQQRVKHEFADHIVVWNEIMQHHLQRLLPASSSTKIHIIGAPRLDYFFHTNKIPTRAQLLNYLQLSPDQPLLHFATTELYPMGYLVKAVAKAYPQANLYASVHPGGNINQHKSLELYGARVRYSFGRRETSPHPAFLYNPSLEDIYYLVALFKHSDLLINHSSTVAIESFLGNTPVINVNYGQPLDWWRWRRSVIVRDFREHYSDITHEHATQVVRNSRQLLAATQNYLAHPEQDAAARAQTLKKMITTTDGNASQKTFALIKNLIS